MSATTRMTKEAASRIQSATARKYGTVAKKSFAARAQRAAARNGVKAAGVGGIGFFRFGGGVPGYIITAVATEVGSRLVVKGYKRSGMDVKVKRGVADLKVKAQDRAANIRDRFRHADEFGVAAPSAEEGEQ